MDRAAPPAPPPGGGHSSSKRNAPRLDGSAVGIRIDFSWREIGFLHNLRLIASEADG
jgi:hypothetical protein